MFEAPQFGSSGSLVDLTPQAQDDAAYELDDIIPPVRNGLSADGKLYAAPFYAESSFLMYRKDVLKKAGVSMLAEPDVGRGRGRRAQGQLARHGRHLPARQAGLGRPRSLVDHGAEHVRRAPGGPPGTTARSARRRSTSRRSARRSPSTSTSSRTRARRTPPTRASTSACPSTRTARSPCGTTRPSPPACSRPTTAPVKGKNGYAAAPVKETDASGWLWSWALAIPKTSTKQDLAWQYIAFATGPEYIKEAGAQIAGGWAAIPPGTRNSTYEIPEYKKAAAGVRRADAEGDELGTDRQPGHRAAARAARACSTSACRSSRTSATSAPQQFSAVISGRTSVDAALEACQQIASQAAGQSATRQAS